MGHQALPTVLDDMSNELPDIGRLALKQALLHWIELDCHMAWCDERVAVHARTGTRARAIMPLSGIGPVTASALSASVDDFEPFDDAWQFGSWLGLTPSQSSTGGKARLGRITKRGDQSLRTLLIQAARSAVFTAHRRSDRLSRWLLALRERRGWQKAAVALANR